MERLGSNSRGLSGQCWSGIGLADSVCSVLVLDVVAAGCLDVLVPWWLQ